MSEELTLKEIAAKHSSSIVTHCWIGGVDGIYDDEIVCPHCGHRHEDSYEHLRGNPHHFEANCDDCGKVFDVEVEYTVHYTSARKVSKK